LVFGFDRIPAHWLADLHGCGGLFEHKRSFRSMRVVPIGDRVVIKRLAAEEATAGGIFLPDMSREKPRQGRVLSVGDGRLLSDGTRATHQVQEGDRVLFSSYAGTEVEINGEELLLMSEEDILAIVE
jgi:chaperonin GroES